MKCRFCKNELKDIFVDLGYAPLSNSFLTEEQLNLPEVHYPLKVFVCSNCFLVQACDSKKSEEIFNEDYIYFSSFSKSWLKHAETYTDMIIDRFGFDGNSLVIEIASNDGYLLQYFKEKNIPVLGIEPAGSTAKIAKEKGIETVINYFGYNLSVELAAKDKKADLVVGNNVFAHVPDINDFVKGLQNILNENGIITLEFPHLVKLIENNQFDTIYHEHYSYYSLYAANKVLEKYNLQIFDVEELNTHGGSLRIFIQHKSSGMHSITPAVNALLKLENNIGINRIEYYESFQTKVNEIRINVLNFLLECQKGNKKIMAYGAAAKGNTLLNFVGINKALIDYVIDASPYKQGKFLPGSHIPVCNEEKLKEDKPDYIVILPWNIKEEIMEQLSYIKDWGGNFIVFIPQLKVYD